MNLIYEYFPSGHEMEIGPYGAPQYVEIKGVKAIVG